MVVLIGATGYVGTAFRAFLESRSIEFAVLGGRDLLHRPSAEVRDFIGSAGADFVINCAGYTGKPNVDACEQDKANCLNGNAVLPGLIREACARLGIGWGHVSSGCIYSGECATGQGWKESDVPNFSFRSPPCSFYSGTKALGEEVLGWGIREGKDSIGSRWEHESEPEGYVWRLRIPFSEIDQPRNYLTKVQSYDRLLEARNSLSHLDDFVAACWECFEKGVPYGIYNVTNPGSITTSEVVDMIRKSGLSDKEFKFFESEEAFMETAAKTPRSNCILDTSKLASAGIVMRPVGEAIEWSLRNWKRRG